MSKTTHEELAGMPKKTLLLICKDAGIKGVSKANVEELIEAILAHQEEAEEAAEELSEDLPAELPEKPEELSGGLVTSVKSTEAVQAGKNLFDMNTLTADDIRLLRPDLAKELASGTEAVKAAVKEELGKASLYHVQIGPIGPSEIEAISEADAVKKFKEQCGLTSHAGHKVSVKRLG